MFKKDAKASGKKGEEFFSFLSGLFKKGVPWSLSEKSTVFAAENMKMVESVHVVPEPHHLV